MFRLHGKTVDELFNMEEEEIRSLIGSAKNMVGECQFLQDRLQTLLDYCQKEDVTHEAKEMLQAEIKQTVENIIILLHEEDAEVKEALKIELEAARRIHI